MDKEECKIKNYIEESIQSKIQIIRDFLCSHSEITVRVVAESKYNDCIQNIVIDKKEESKPLCIITLIDSDKNFAEEVSDYVRILLVSFGYEVLNEEKKIWKVPECMLSHVSELFDLIYKNSKLKLFYEHDSINNWSKIILSSHDKSILLVNLKSMTVKYVHVVEKQLSLLIASMGKTIEATDGTKLNMYGCIELF